MMPPRMQVRSDVSSAARYRDGGRSASGAGPEHRAREGYADAERHDVDQWNVIHDVGRELVWSSSRWIGKTVRIEGRLPHVHINRAPLTTCIGMGLNRWRALPRHGTTSQDATGRWDGEHSGRL
jgi:hypothetical protein